jgi:hypothetical protein
VLLVFGKELPAQRKDSVKAIVWSQFAD